MKLTKDELNCAKDRQLSAVGITRKDSKGWMRQAMARDFTEDEIQRFKDALGAKNKTTPKRNFSDRAQLLIEAQDAANKLSAALTRLIAIEERESA